MRVLLWLPGLVVFGVSRTTYVEDDASPVQPFLVVWALSRGSPQHSPLILANIARSFVRSSIHSSYWWLRGNPQSVLHDGFWLGLSCTLNKQQLSRFISKYLLIATPQRETSRGLSRRASQYSPGYCSRRLREGGRV